MPDTLSAAIVRAMALRNTLPEGITRSELSGAILLASWLGEYSAENSVHVAVRAGLIEAVAETSRCGLRGLQIPA